MTGQIKKAVFPVAGLGTRFLPASKACPKEMLPVVDKPLIQYAVEEAIEAGITDLIFITGRNKRSIEDHFDKAYELETELLKKNKQESLEAIQSIIPGNVTCIYIRQSEALGLGHAVSCARAAVGNEPFAVILADDLIKNPNQGCLDQMVSVFDDYQKSVIAVETIPETDTDKYGIVKTISISPGIEKLTSIVEKPKPEVAPSTLAVVGRYILSPAIFDALVTVESGSGGEIQLTDAIASLMQKEDVYCLKFAGKRFDCGSKLGYLQANVEYGLEHKDLCGEFADYLKKIIK